LFGTTIALHFLSTYLGVNRHEGWGMPLTNFAVVHAHVEPLNRVLVHCFDGRQMVLVFISREAVDDYFEHRSLTPQQRNLLMMRNLELLEPVIERKYAGGKVTAYHGTGGTWLPQVDLSLADLRQTTEPMTDTVLDVAAGAGYRRA
jgi:hypothetical protein